ncbi:MAG: hypothetical protein V4685_15985 [Bacteroidota bacterium]
MRKNKAILLILFFSINTIAYSQGNLKLEKQIASLYDLNDSLLRIWRADINGCKRERVLIVDSLLANKYIIGMPEKVFLLLFGNPEVYNPEGILTYGIGFTFCDGANKKTEDATGKELVVFIDEGKILRYGFDLID